MSQTTVANDPRAYLTTVAVTASDPKRAAQLANWVASEYLRGQLQEQAVEAYAVVEREMTAVSSVFGPHHPSYINGSAKLLRLKAELATAQKGGSDAGTGSSDGKGYGQIRRRPIIATGGSYGAIWPQYHARFRFDDLSFTKASRTSAELSNFGFVCSGGPCRLRKPKYSTTETLKKHRHQDFHRSRGP
jgi:hypothetical protein